MPQALLRFGAAGKGQEDPAEEITEPGWTGKLSTKQQGSVLQKAGIGLLRLGAGITDQGEALTDRPERNGKDTCPVDPAAESHR